MKNALVILNYPLQNQIDVGHIDLLKIQFENMLNIFDEVHVISPRDKRKYKLGWNPRIKIHSTGCNSKGTYYLSPLADLFYTLKLIKSKNIKAIRALAPSSGFIAVLAGKISGIPSVISVHMDRALVADKEGESKFKHALLDFVEGWTYRNANLVPVISNYLGNYVKKLSKVSDKKIYLHYNFVNTEVFKPISHKNKVPILIFVGRIVKVHGVDIIVKVLSKILKQKKVILKICGDGPERKNIEMLAKELKVIKYIKFLGRVDHEKDLPKEMATSDIFVSPALSGFTIIEAMAAGIPIIGTDIEWTSEVVNNSNGILIENSTEGLQKGILNMLSADLKKLGINSRKQAEEKFSLHAWNKREVDIYNGLQSNN